MIPNVSISEKRAGSGEGIRANILFGLAVSILLVGGVGAWAATTSLAGAVIASGNVVVESNSKKVQHQTGGIVGEILVKEGDRVSAGDVIVRLDETMTRANLQIITQQYDRTVARQARLQAERLGLPEIKFPEDLAKRAADPDVDGGDRRREGAVRKPHQGSGWAEVAARGPVGPAQEADRRPDRPAQGDRRSGRAGRDGTTPACRSSTRRSWSRSSG